DARSSPSPCFHRRQRAIRRSVGVGESRVKAMSVRPYRDIQRRKCRQIHVGKVPVGGDAPITVQSITNTLTTDVQATIDQIRGLEDAGADIVRVSVPDA